LVVFKFQNQFSENRKSIDEEYVMLINLDLYTIEDVQKIIKENTKHIKFFYFFDSLRNYI